MNKSKLFQHLVSGIENVRGLPPYPALLKRANKQELHKALILPTIHIHPNHIKTIRNISHQARIIRIPHQARIIRLYLPHLQAFRQHNLILKMLVIMNKISLCICFLYMFDIFLFYYIYILFFLFLLCFYIFFILFYIYILFFILYVFIYFLFFILFYVIVNFIFIILLFWFLFIYFFSFVLINTLILSKFNQFELVRISLVLWISQHLILIFYHMKIFTFIKFYAIFSNYSKII